MTPAVRIHQDARGQWSAHPVQLNYSSPARLDVALAKVRQGRTVFVAEDDAEAVLAVARGMDGKGSD